MKKTRTLLLLLLSLVLMLGMFSACNNDKKDDGSEPDQPADFVSLKNLSEYTVIVPDIPSDVENVVYRQIREKINSTYNVTLGVATDFVKRGDQIPTDTLEILVGKTNRQESVDALKPLRNDDWSVGMVGDRLVIIGATDPALTEAVNWFYQNCFTEEGFRVPSELFTHHGKYNYQEISINGVSLQEFVILTDSLSKTVAEAMQRAITFASGYTPEVLVSQPQNDNRINVKIDKNLGANEWKYYCEDGQIHIYGEDADALKAGYSYFIDKYVTSPDSPKIENGIADSGTLEQTALVSFNLPTSYGAFEIQSYTYDADTLWANFLEAKDELPDEVTVLDSYNPEDYPMSMKNQIFVATDGNDENAGTKEAPVATIQKALDILSSRGAYGGVVWIRGGTYTQTAVVDADNTGFDASPLFICAYEDEEVVLNGYYTVKGSDFTAVTESDPLWERMDEEARKHIVVADLTALGIDVDSITKMGAYSQPYVYVDDVVQKIATFPNERPCWEEEFLDESGITSSTRPITMIFNPKEVPLDEWTLTDDMWITGSLVFEWTYGSWRATEIDLDRNAVVFENYDMWDRHQGLWWRPTWELYFINFIEILDMETEWYIDRETGRMYYYPTSDFGTDSVIDILGDEREAAISVESAGHIVIKNLTFDKMPGSGVKIAAAGGGSVCTDVIVDSCKFERIPSKSGVSAAGLRVGAIRSEFIDCGINLTGSGRSTLTPSNNFVQNCYFHGYTSRGGGVGFGNGVGDILSHNLLVDCGFTMNASNECIVEYNEVIGGPYATLDTGYIYCVGANLTARGNHIRYNYFHDPKTAITGVYLDINCSGQYVYGNIVTQKSGYGRIISTTAENIFYNNIFAHSGSSGFDSRTMRYFVNTEGYQRHLDSNPYMENAFWDRYSQYYRLTEMMEAMIERGGEEMYIPDIDVVNNPEDYNAYVASYYGHQWIKNNVVFDIPYFISTTDTFALEHLVHGEETNLIVDSADGLGFADDKNGDYSFGEDSPIFDKIPDWEPIPQDKIGLLYDVELDS